MRPSNHVIINRNHGSNSDRRIRLELQYTSKCIFPFGNASADHVRDGDALRVYHDGPLGRTHVGPIGARNTDQRNDKTTVAVRWISGEGQQH